MIYVFFHDTHMYPRLKVSVVKPLKVSVVKLSPGISSKKHRSLDRFANSSMISIH